MLDFIRGFCAIFWRLVRSSELRSLLWRIWGRFLIGSLRMCLLLFSVRIAVIPKSLRNYWSSLPPKRKLIFWKIWRLVLLGVLSLWIVRRFLVLRSVPRSGSIIRLFLLRKIILFSSRISSKGLRIWMFSLRDDHWDFILRLLQMNLILFCSRNLIGCKKETFIFWFGAKAAIMKRSKLIYKQL